MLIHTVFGSVSSRPNTLHYVCIFILSRYLPFIHSVFVAILTRCLPLINAIFVCFPPDVSLPYGTCVDYTCSAVYADGTVSSKKVSYCNGEYRGSFQHHKYRIYCQMTEIFYCSSLLYLSILINSGFPQNKKLDYKFNAKV